MWSREEVEEGAVGRGGTMVRTEGEGSRSEEGEGERQEEKRREREGIKDRIILTRRT